MSVDAALIHKAIAWPGGRWFEGLGRELARAKWLAVNEVTGLDPDSYGTVRYALRDGSAPRDTVAVLDLPDAFEAERPLVVEDLQGDVLARYADLGLDFYPAGDLDVHLATASLHAGLRRIADVPGAAAAVGALMASLHVLRPEGSDYDVSYSDPVLPFSVFVGISGPAQANGDLRLAEGILHESMHLQLTLIEETVPLVAGAGERLHSPWQGTMRPIQGILHGLYVFRVIQDFCQALIGGARGTAEELAYLSGRIARIEREIDTLDGLDVSGELTEAGRRFASVLLAR